MKNNIFIFVVLIAFLNLILTGCYTSKLIYPVYYSEQEIEKIITVKKDTISFSQNENHIIEVTEDSIEYTNVNGDSSSIYHDQINSLIVKEYNKSKSAGLIVPVVVGGLLVLINILINNVRLVD